MRQLKNPQWWLLLSTSLLFAIWPVPHTNSVREALFAFSIVLAVWLGYRRRAALGVWTEPLRWPAFWLIALSAWIVVVALFLSPEAKWSLDEIRGHWLKPVLALLLGALTAAVCIGDRNKPRPLWTFLAVVLLFHICVINIDAVVHLFQGVDGYRAMGLMAGPDKASYLSNIALVVLLSDLLTRLRIGRRLLPVSGWALAAALVLVLSSVLAETIRSGLVVSGVLFLCAIGLYLTSPTRVSRGAWLARTGIVACILVTIAGIIVLAGSIKPGSSWQKMNDAVPIALDTETHKTWQNVHQYPLPKLADGSAIDESTYLRVAWMKEGLVASTEYPLGVGFGRNVFGHAMQAKYGVWIAHSHSSFIDLLVGIGIPGVLLWFAFLASLLWFAARGLVHGWGCALFLFVVDFGTRMLIDSNVRDHMFQMFMFLVGVTAMFTAVTLTGGKSQR